MSTILKVVNIEKYYGTKSNLKKALDRVQFSPYRYLVWILQEAPKLAQLGTDWAKHFLPGAAPDDCKVNR